MKYIASFFVLILIVQDVSGQYFGRNKPRYRSFNFKVTETPHFDIYHYFKNKEFVEDLSQDVELWYDYHSKALNHEIDIANPLIFYNNHAEFQQTNAISGSIGVGTGGVTEGLKNRVIMPVSFSNQQTHQVLGHELVHAFQFNIIIEGDSTSIRNLSNVPLWIIEGMAEYMSIGRVDAFTSMWMRNAILHDNVPTLAKMANPKYFPYRYGQAAWSFLAGLYGDQTLKPFLKETAKNGIAGGALKAFGTDLDNLSTLWKNGLETHFEPYLKDRKESRIGKTLLSKANSGRLNVSPSLSPNGRYVIFLSEKDLFSTDLYMADARTGEIIRKLSSLAKDSDLDNFNYIESTGTWSPNSKEFAFVGFQKGANVLVIKNVENGKTSETFDLGKVRAFTNPTWSPDGKEIIVTGSVEGRTDLYAVNVRSHRVRQLTDDKYSEIQANYNSDGTKLVFSTDQRSFTEGRTLGRYTYDIAIMDLSSGEQEILDIWHGADNINPTYDHEDNIYFMSDGDGYRNMYRYIVSSGETYRMTDFLTGLSGIARYSPVLTASRKRDRVLFTHYSGGEYIVKSGTSENLLNQKVEDVSTVDFGPATLPVAGLDHPDIVNAALKNKDSYEALSAEDIKAGKYRANFKLDYIGGGAGVGVSNNNFGTFAGLQGGIDFLFSDIVGNQQLFARAQVSGEVLDFGGQLSYLNRSNRLAWGGGISHVPLRFPTLGNRTIESIQGQQVLVDRINVNRIFEQRISGFTHYPFSTTLRLEGGVDVGLRSFRQDQSRFFIDPQTGILIGSDRENQEVGDQLVLNNFFAIRKGLIGSANIALVGDNSYFGLTAPVSGYRYRLSVERSYGIDDFTAVLGDYRKYHRAGRFTLAARGLGFFRFDQDVSSVIPLFVGQQGFVRGYDFVFDRAQNGEGLNTNDLLGSKLALASFEIRTPFTGPKQLALIGSKVLFSDLSLFFDAGVAFNEFSDFGAPSSLQPEVVMSAGVSVRLNLFGALIVEPYWAYPFQGDGSVTFGLNFIPGW